MRSLEEFIPGEVGILTREIEIYRSVSIEESRYAKTKNVQPDYDLAKKNTPISKCIDLNVNGSTADNDFEKRFDGFIEAKFKPADCEMMQI